MKDVYSESYAIFFVIGISSEIGTYFPELLQQFSNAKTFKTCKKIPTLILNEDNLKTVFPLYKHYISLPISYASLNFIVRHAV